jgi:hypothetical protein
MRRAIFASTILLGIALAAPANTAATAGSSTMKASTQRHAASQQNAKHAGHTKRVRAARASSGVVTYNRDSKDPNIGWHDDGGMRVCHQDCDNPEIPGSGYTCRDVQVLGMAIRECDSSN